LKQGEIMKQMNLSRAQLGGFIGTLLMTAILNLAG